MVDDMAKRLRSVAKRLRSTEVDSAETSSGNDDAHSSEAAAGDSAGQASNAGSGKDADEQQEGQRFRNRTPDRLRLRKASGAEFVFAPLEERILRGKNWAVQELLHRELLEEADPKKEKSLDWLLVPAFWLAIIAWIVGTNVAENHPGDEEVVWAIIVAIYIALIGPAVIVTLTGGAAAARQAAQFGMLLLVILVGIGLPFVVAWRFGQEELWSDNSMAVLGRLLQVVFVSLACIVPGLLFFLFDRQRLSTLRDRFEQQIFRLDPNVLTLSDVYARYGRQIEETYGQSRDPAAMRLARQGRWPILVATIALALGWIFTLVPAGSLGEQTTAQDIARLFAPQRNAVAFGFLGAYFYAVNLVLRRYARGDLRPKAYSAITVRVLVVIILGWLVDAITPVSGDLVLVVAFFIGIVPETFLTFLREIYRNRMVARLSKSLEEALPLQHLEGIDLYDRARLLEEGITNIQALAHHDLVDLMLETRIPAGRLVDWVDQAILHLHIVDPIQDAAVSPTQSKGRLRGFDVGTATEPAEGVAADSPRSRERAQQLRRLGIRTATDLLTVYHKYQNDDSALDQLSRAVTGNSADDNGQSLKILVATLQDEEWLTFICNWHCNVTTSERVIEITKYGRIIRETHTDSSSAGQKHPDGPQDQDLLAQENGQVRS